MLVSICLSVCSVVLFGMVVVGRMNSSFLLLVGGVVCS